MAMATLAHITPEYRAERVRLHELRRSIEGGLQSMIDLLDLLDPDPEAEPSLAAPEAGRGRHTSQERWADGSADDGEFAVDDEGEEEAEDNPREDYEPSLGSLGSCGPGDSQLNWTGGTRDDREGEHDGSEPDDDGEPSLGSVTGWNGSQLHWSAGTADDREDEHDGREADGMHIVGGSTR